MLPPYLAMLDAQISEIAAQLLARNLAWFTKRDIEVIEPFGFWLLRGHGANNPWNMLCNGLLFDTRGKLISMPPVKLYNLNEPGVVVANLKTTDLLEKVTGQMVCVCFPSANPTMPLAHTDRSIAGWGSPLWYIDPKEEPLKTLMPRLLHITYSRAYKLMAGNPSACTMTFQYKNNDLYLVQGRHLRSLFENCEDELDGTAAKLDVLRPLRFPCTNGWDTICSALREHTETFLVRDTTTGERANVYIKVARPKLVATARLKYLVPYWVAGEQQQIILQFPQTAEAFARLQKAATDRRFAIKVATRRFAQSRLNKKDLAEALRTSTVPTWMHKFVLVLHNKPFVEWDDIIMRGLKKLPAKKMLRVLLLKDAEPDIIPF